MINNHLTTFQTQINSVDAASTKLNDTSTSLQQASNRLSQDSSDIVNTVKSFNMFVDPAKPQYDGPINNISKLLQTMEHKLSNLAEYIKILSQESKPMEGKSQETAGNKTGQ